MSWNRTVTCSACWDTGHNRSGCPKLKEKYEREKKENPDSYWVKDYEAKLARRKTRSCSYCKEEKHTKRTCKHIKADKAKTVSMNKEWRVQALEHLKHIGLGIGALVQFDNRNSWGDSNVENVMISDILWKNLTFRIKHGGNPSAFSVRPVADFARTTRVDFPIDADGQLTQEHDYGTRAEVLGPVSGSSIEASVPEGWLTGEGPEIDEMFTDRDGKLRERYYIDWVEK